MLGDASERTQDLVDTLKPGKALDFADAPEPGGTDECVSAPTIPLPVFEEIIPHGHLIGVQWPRTRTVRWLRDSGEDNESGIQTSRMFSGDWGYTFSVPI